MLFGMRILAAEPQLRSVDYTLAAGAIMAGGSAATALVMHVKCPILWATGCYCACCGATRAVFAVLHGDAGTAMRDNGLVMLIGVLVLVRYIVRYAGGRALVARVDHLVEHVNMNVWTLLLLAWTVLRNLPWFWYLGPPRSSVGLAPWA